MRMTIGVHTHITNPLSSGYLCYLACIESWARVADQVVVVDGGSTDNSVPLLMDWLGPLSSKICVISPPEAYWGTGDNWAWPQIAINRQIGLEHLDTDWAIHVDADHVVDMGSMTSFLQQIEAVSNRTLLSMWVGSYHNGSYHRRVRTRAWILNWSLIKREKLPYAYGIERRSGTGLDYPLRIIDQRVFRDPVTGVSKSYYLGDTISAELTTELECLRYGHFFFTKEQCLNKCMRIERAISRFRGSPVRNEHEIEIELKLKDIIRFEKKEEILSKSHPPEIARVIENFYTEGMLGGAVYRESGFLEDIVNNTYLWSRRAFRFLRRFF